MAAPAEARKFVILAVLTPAMKKQALAQPLTFSDAGWAIAVSSRGRVWKRVHCADWC
jgi:hypothetical protein